MSVIDAFLQQVPAGGRNSLRSTGVGLYKRNKLQAFWSDNTLFLVTTLIKQELDDIHHPYKFSEVTESKI